jgi:hypothetical protein
MHRFLRLSVLLAGMFIMAGGYAADTTPPITTADDLGPQIEQPIEFPHNRHAGMHDPADDADPSKPAKGGMEINCMYCHTYARRSMVAGIPPLRKCIGCHQSIESVKESPRIKKLFEYWESKKPVPWKKVHDLPDFVRFNHERHVQRFVFKQGRPVQEACGYCHGDIKTMTVARRQKPITMGWCAECHQKDHLVDASSTETTHGPNDCFTCHK